MPSVVRQVVPPITGLGAAWLACPAAQGLQELHIAAGTGDTLVQRCTEKAAERAGPTRTLLDADEYTADSTAKAGPLTPQWRRRWSRGVCFTES